MSLTGLHKLLCITVLYTNIATTTSIVYVVLLELM